jgi:hypothetical protein
VATKLNRLTTLRVKHTLNFSKVRENGYGTRKSPFMVVCRLAFVVNQYWYKVKPRDFKRKSPIMNFKIVCLDSLGVDTLIDRLINMIFT